MPYKTREQKNAYYRKWYKKNAHRMRDEKNRRKKDNARRFRKLLRRYKRLKGCVDCGYKDNPVALHFDHVRGTKTNNISTLVRGYYSKENLKKEIAKCEVRCANCHAIVTEERRDEEAGSSLSLGRMEAPFDSGVSDQ